ncbi:Transcriptional regulatory protein, C terminal [Desulfonatronum thiosulfatophilum]|uniref:Transcriptional regulatory protein, C terminal n=1 Tax=Desulfonatronum thiosulfatophilum TaxID=617002 RepID=A0A1G6CKH2_9BACT|nr:BTAD domain-containing putative transcriptional regulator [Desulfonatronum thiosulfatophilum]SDB33242.1 Transcriptional regulatory protein, C terminal [Desulfonatronum thiosulfatophilum]
MQISFARFIPPEIGTLVVRQRLFDCLDEASSRPIIWISSPPGSGKTVLVASYVLERQQPLIWYQMDESDIEPAVFFSRLAQASTSVLADEHVNLPSLQPLQVKDLSSFTDHFFKQLAQRLPENCFLVLDNYQVEMDSRVHKRILEAIAVLPGGCRTLITSRKQAPRHSVRMLVERKMSFLDWHDLRFTLEESKALLGSEKFSNEVYDQLHEKTDGWAAGLVLLGESLRRGGSIVGASPWMPMRDVFDYLDVELFDKLTPELRDFLVRTSFLRTMTPDMAKAMSGSDHAEAILMQLFRNNRFTFRRVSPHFEFEYHPLFTLYLQSIAENEYSAEELSILRCRAAEILESSGRIMDAADLWLAAGAAERLERLILEHADQMTHQGRFQTLEKWITDLPADALDQEPWLVYWLGICRQIVDPEGSRKEFRKAFEMFRQRRDENGLLAAWCGAVDTFMYDWSDFLSLGEWISLLETLLDTGLEVPPTELGVRAASCMVAALVYQHPQQSRKIQQWLEVALRPNSRCSAGYIHLHTRFHAAYHAMWMGDLTRLRIINENVQQVMGNPDVPMVHVLNAKCLEAMVHNLCFAQGDQALKVVKEGLQLARRHDLNIWHFMLYGQGVFAALTVGDVSTADKYLAQMERIASRNKRFARGQYHYMAASYHLYRGNFLLAAQDAGKALRIAEETGARFAYPFFALSKAQTCHEIEEVDERDRLMESLKDFIDESGSRLLEYMWLLCAAHFALDQDQTDKALRLLIKGFNLGRREGYVNMFWQWRPKMVARLCMVALQKNIETEYAKLLIRRRNLFPESPPLEVSIWPWLLRLHTLGRFELIREGDVIHFSGKLQRRPLDLLKILTINEDKGVSEDELCDMLWPDSDGDRAHSSLTTTVSRLRGLLGCHESIVVSNARISLNARLCWADAWAFVHLCKQIAKLEQEFGAACTKPLRNGDTARLFLLAQQALDLYQGHFLPDDLAHSWTIPVRERLRGKFYDLVAIVGDVLELSDNWSSARRVYLQALEVDELHEDFNGRAIRCAHLLDRAGEARSLFHRYRERLKTELGLNVSPELQSLVRKLGVDDAQDSSR